MYKALSDTNDKKIKVPALAVSIVVFFLLLYFPVFEDPQPQKAFALLVMVAILWMTEAIPLALTGLMIPVVAIVLQIVNTGEAFRGFSHPILFLFMGGFVIAGALTRYGLDKLLAQKLIALAKGNFYKSAILLMFATSITACWVSNTAATAMMIPLGLGLLSLLKKHILTAESKFLILGIAYAANIGGVITMVASPPNAIGAAILGLSFSTWIRYAIPVFLLTFPVMVVLLTLYFKPDRKMRIDEMVVVMAQNAPIKTIGSIFAFTVTLWVLDSTISPLLKIPDGFSSLVAVMAIFLLYITQVLKWKEIIKSIQWDVLLLFGGGLTLGMIIDHSGLGIILVNKAAHLITVVPLFLFLWIIVIFSIVLTEFMSNTASAALILPLLFTLATHLQVNPMVLVFPATIAASYGFMLPAGTPPNAMAFATGLVPQKDMMKIGLVLNLVFSIILTLFFYFIF
ncbi:transporter [Flavobacterium noncentrifugens]|uniref:Solute carrier family 13 (Sodium-dependent dicarboxylate transporter), member 2/3/5 n=1 Tax=Flavobacterium noncentrifugens TaxID=1128970 RepID=A0A1G8WUB1_9FLAO|nr:SLC13 family permease [Flavobacterium noncentrifugens]GEP51054.1 transporter [Flavobacterium noncentrifugens]SDJ81753.1 solute carrier family 13 (sodium-dependent dicarboxylate transporter), member 2/3/5 [Flavobacterium noncentrifugens]